MDTYEVKYKVGNTSTGRKLQLKGGTESEAISKLKEQGAVSKDADVIVLSLKKC